MAFSVAVILALIKNALLKFYSDNKKQALPAGKSESANNLHLVSFSGILGPLALLRKKVVDLQKLILSSCCYGRSIIDLVGCGRFPGPKSSKTFFILYRQSQLCPVLHRAKAA